jgi:regulator of RNase E activity RraA
MDRDMTSKPTNNPDVVKQINRVAKDIVAKAAGFQPAIMADVQGRRGTMHGRIAAVSPEMKCCGPAYTVEVRPGDNLMIHAALALAEAGDVIVVDGKADQTCALMGALMMNQAKVQNLGGVIVDAAIRDVLELRELGFPVFAVGANPNGPTKLVPGRINHAISCGGVTVNPGDLIMGDADGVVVIARETAPQLLTLAAKKVADEQNRVADLKAKRNLVPDWLDGALKSAGVLKAGEQL